MHRSMGFSLIEVLISIVILSVALLGTAALTASSLKNTNTSYYRSQATVMADDILDRMRANVGKARGGQYNIAADGSLTAAGGTMERFDCQEWVDTLTEALPGGTGTVNVVGGVATVVIGWDGGADSFKTVSQL